MKVIVFGATGTVGRLTVEKMLAEGHEVTAFARNAGGMTMTHPALSKRDGNAFDSATVAAAIGGHDAVVVTLGAGMSRSSTIRSRGTLNVISGMQAQGVRRLICQSTLGAHESWGNLDWFWKHVMFGALLRQVFREHELQELLVRASGLDWTIVRPSAFSEGPATDGFHEGFGPARRHLKLKITRADVAAFLARQVSERTYLGRAVAISN